MKGRRYNFGKKLMDKDASKYVGAAQSNLLAAQADFGKSLIEKDASKYTGFAQISLLAAQDDFGKALMDKDPTKYSGGAKRNLMAAQDDIGKALREKDPSKYSGFAQSNILAAQSNEGKNYLDWKAGTSFNEAAIDEVRSKIAKYTSDKRVFGLSSPDGTTTTPLDPEDAFRKLVGVYNSSTMKIADYFMKRETAFTAFDRAIQFENSVDRNKRWPTASGVRLCAGSMNEEGSMPDFAPYSTVPLWPCPTCDRTYETIKSLNKHKRENGH